MAQIHFNHVFTNTAFNHAAGIWAHPDDRQADGFMTGDYWCDVARLLERGGFDGAFFADVLSIGEDFAAETIESGGVPYPDPMALLPLMAAATTHLGFGVTLSTISTPPFLAVRRLGTLDILTGGRIAWNVVTSYLPSDFAALGLERPAHDVRYDSAEDYMEICYRLWDAFPADAVIRQRDTVRLVDAAKVSRVDFKGKYYSCQAYPIIPQSPQGRPLIFQAGASGRGMQFAATHADAVFALQPRVGMVRYVNNTAAAAQSVGRPRPRVFFGVQPFVGGTEEEVRRRIAEIEARVPLGNALNRLGGLLGRVFTEDELDKPIALSETQASQGWMTAIAQWGGDRPPTLREAALHFAVSPMTPRITGTPEQVADTLEAWWRETGCYGFTISPNLMPSSLEAFVDEVVPILRRRGLMRTEYAGTTYRENLLQD